MDSPSEWEDYFNLCEPENEPFPAPFDHADDFRRLIFLKCLRPDKLISAIKVNHVRNVHTCPNTKSIVIHFWCVMPIYLPFQMFIANNLGNFFIESVPFELTTIYHEGNARIPLLFLLSGESDPVAHIMTLAATKGMVDKYDAVSVVQHIWLVRGHQCNNEFVSQLFLLFFCYFLLTD